MNKLIAKAALAVIILVSSPLSYANTHTHIDIALAKLSSAYGGGELISINALTLHDYCKSLWLGQNESTELPGFSFVILSQ